MNFFRQVERVGRVFRRRFVTATQADFLAIIARYRNCWMCMSRIAQELRITVRHAFRIQSELIAMGEMTSFRTREAPPEAGSPDKLRCSGMALRAPAGQSGMIQLVRRAEIDQRSQQKADREREERRRKNADRDRKRAERTPSDASPASAPPFHREFSRTEDSAPPITGVPAAAIAALYGRPPPD